MDTPGMTAKDLYPLLSTNLKYHPSKKPFLEALP
jgi:hypothetical protein